MNDAVGVDGDSFSHVKVGIFVGVVGPLEWRRNNRWGFLLDG